MGTIRKELRVEADDDVAVAEFWLAFEGQDPGNMVSIDETSLGETGAISLTSSHMRRLFIRFPEKVLIDCTHKTNWVICGILVMDAFGYGQFVQHTVIETNSD
ncbi:hypothetical protein PHMEG_00032016 [Phytophthora megakarya]|uniref:ZSWIM1/3 RNaseH-like domain-containing protein n=1 Tax=Phytophthora megakarya TaxID=4795 RepID=A0A225UY58_9STRA|nr:hypothetical protein PHMEG_00032016 [Phytophthora megakarya]